MTDKGYIKLGGKALSEIEKYDFVDSEKINYDEFNIRLPNSYVNYQGSCPNHPDLYKSLENFDVKETFDVICLIDDIYKSAELKYY